MRSVCRYQAIISTACTADSETNPLPLCEFVGQHAAEADWHLISIRSFCEV